MANQSLSSTENEEKFIWDGTLENLKKFMADKLKLQGKWTSPGGETKLFKSPLVSLKRQSKTSKWITISGTLNEVNDVIKQLKSICEKAAMNLTTKSIKVDENVDASINSDSAEASVIELTCPESMPVISNQLNLTAPMPFNNEQTIVEDKLSCIEAEMKSFESKFLDRTLSLANDLNNLKEHCLENNSGYIKGLRLENISLKEENKTLKDRLETTRFALADLNTKVKDLKNEKACLITSLKILHQDYFQSDENGLNNKESAASSSAVNSGPWLKPSSTCKSSKSVDSNIQICNKFESLDCKGDDPETLNNTPTKGQNNLRTNLGKKRKGGAKISFKHYTICVKDRHVIYCTPCRV